MGQGRKEGTMGPGDKPPEKEDSVDFTILDVMITIRSMSACDA